MLKLYDAGKERRNWDTGDCTVRALATARQISYMTAYGQLLEAQRLHQACSFRLFEFLRRDPQAFGVIGYIPLPARRGQKRYNGETFCARFPKGRYILRMAHHAVAVVDGVLYDKFNSLRKCVYGAWEIKA